MNPLIQSKNATILPVLIALTLGCFAFSPQVRAVCHEGCLTNQNTLLGDDALNDLASGVANTACGFEALFFNTDGHYNTGIGAFALQSNTTGIENTAIGYGALLYQHHRSIQHGQRSDRRSFSTRPAAITRPPVCRRFRTTPPAITTSHWAIMPVEISLRAVTTSTSATLV